MFFFCGCLAGPSLDYYDYDIFIKRNNVNQNIPSKFLETFRLFRNALFIQDGLLESLMSAEYDETCLLYKILWLNLTITLHRTIYFSGWLFSESGLAAAGFTYNGKQDEKDKWLRIRSIDHTIDWTTNPKDKTELWNISFQVWLKMYVYLRVYLKSVLKSCPAKSQKAQLITFAVSWILSWLLHCFLPLEFNWNDQQIHPQGRIEYQCIKNMGFKYHPQMCKILLCQFSIELFWGWILIDEYQRQFKILCQKPRKKQ